MSSIQFNSVNQTFNLQERRRLKSFIPSIFTHYNLELETLSYIFCSDDYLLSINNQFLQHDYYTDIITFDLSVQKPFIIGEIYISIDRIKDNAKSLNLSFKQELHRVIFHGALHLCGHKDKRKADKETMTRAEDHYLQLYFNNAVL